MQPWTRRFGALLPQHLQTFSTFCCNARAISLPSQVKQTGRPPTRKGSSMPLGIEVVGRALANRTRRGLYAGRKVLFGNRVSKNGGNRTRRKWLPNAQKKRMYSEQLDAMVPLRLTTGAMRSIDKAGGLDAYVFKIKNSSEDSDKAEQLRQWITFNRAQQKEEELKAAQSIKELERKRLKESRTSLLPAAAAVLENKDAPLK